MERRIVEVLRLRVSDVMVGDVINRDPAATGGWFSVHELNQLPNGDINAVGSSAKLSIVAGPYDIVGLQVEKGENVAVAPPAIPGAA